MNYSVRVLDFTAHLQLARVRRVDKELTRSRQRAQRGAAPAAGAEAVARQLPSAEDIRGWFQVQRSVAAAAARLMDGDRRVCCAPAEWGARECRAFFDFVTGTLCKLTCCVMQLSSTGFSATFQPPPTLADADAAAVAIEAMELMLRVSSTGYRAAGRGGLHRMGQAARGMWRLGRTAPCSDRKRLPAGCFCSPVVLLWQCQAAALHKQHCSPAWDTLRGCGFS